MIGFEEEIESDTEEVKGLAQLHGNNFAEGNKMNNGNGDKNGKKKGKDDGLKVKVSGGLEDIGLEDMMASVGATNMR